MLKLNYRTQLIVIFNDQSVPEICSACHPFYTGKKKMMDTTGRVDRFKKMAEKAAAKKEATAKAKAAKKEKTEKKPAKKTVKKK